MIYKDFNNSDIRWSIFNYAFLSKKEKCCQKDCKDCPFVKKKKKQKKK